MTNRKCPTCKQYRDIAASGSCIDSKGICGDCILAMQTNAPLLTEDGIITPIKIAKFVIEYNANKHNDKGDRMPTKQKRETYKEIANKWETSFNKEDIKKGGFNAAWEKLTKNEKRAWHYANVSPHMMMELNKIEEGIGIGEFQNPNSKLIAKYIRSKVLFL